MKNARPKVFKPTFTQTRQTQQTRYDSFRGSSNSRGYGYKWRKLRKLFLEVNPLCNHCSTDEHPVKADLPHHIIPVDQAPELLLAWDNLEAVCSRCHGKIHAEKF